MPFVGIIPNALNILIKLWRPKVQIKPDIAMILYGLVTFRTFNNVLITIDNGKNYDGKVYKISSKANASTRTFNVEILIDNDSEILKGGMTAEAIIKTNLEKAFGISPAHLIVNDNGELFVKTVNNNKVKMQKVVIVKSIQDKVFISGLSDGSILLTTGQAFVAENDIINYKLES